MKYSRIPNPFATKWKRGPSASFRGGGLTSDAAPLHILTWPFKTPRPAGKKTSRYGNSRALDARPNVAARRGPSINLSPYASRAAARRARARPSPAKNRKFCVRWSKQKELGFLPYVAHATRPARRPPRVFTSSCGTKRTGRG